MTANRHGASNDLKADAAARVTQVRGHISNADFDFRVVKASKVA
jgi:hypothetical protein